jgi:20S proteasome alpha/beta subunit
MLFSLFELREGHPITVSAASKYFSNVLYGYRNSGLMIVSTHYTYTLDTWAYYDTYTIENKNISYR